MLWSKHLTWNHTAGAGVTADHRRRQRHGHNDVVAGNDWGMLAQATGATLNEVNTFAHGGSAVGRFGGAGGSSS
jgi:hypothetical protein